jgi:arabinogalactan oligomer/maltooligosaccharide transport system substrate-binding protein
MKLFLRRPFIILSLIVFLNACAVSKQGTPSKTQFQEPSEPLSEAQPNEEIAALGNETQIPTLLDPEATHTATINPSVVITVWHGLNDTQVLALNEIIKNFLVVNPGIQVDLVYNPYDDLLVRFINAVNTGLDSSILLGGGEWGPSLYDAGVIADLTGEFPMGLQMEISPPALEAVAYRDALVGLPYALSGVVMVRNTALIPEAPKTFEDLIRLSQDSTKGRVVGAYLERGDLFAFPQLAACGGLLNYPNGYPAFNNAVGICWFDLLKSFEVAGPVSFNTDDDKDRFLDGKVGLIFEGTWNLTLFSEVLGENLAIDAWPAIYGNNLSGYVWTDNIYLNANLTDENKDGALAFSEFLLSPESQSVFAEIGQIPATLYRDVRERLIFQSAAALSHGVPFPVIPEMDIYWEPMHEALVAVLENDVDPNIALQTALDEITENVETFKDKEVDF